MHRSPGWIARKDRFDSSVDAVVHRRDGTCAPAKLTNFSDEGCRIETAAMLAIGERMEIAIPEMGHIQAQIRWSLNGHAGVRFDQGDADID